MKRGVRHESGREEDHDACQEGRIVISDLRKQNEMRRIAFLTETGVRTIDMMCVIASPVAGTRAKTIGSTNPTAVSDRGHSWIQRVVWTPESV